MERFLSENPASQAFVISRQRRDATVVIRGYVYQVNTTLLKWIELEPDQRLELEAGEDIDSLQEAVANPCPFGKDARWRIADLLTV